MDFEDVLQRGVVEELPLLINLRVGLRMNKHDGCFRGQVGVTPKQWLKLVDRGLMLTPLPGNRVPFNRTANRGVQTSASYFKCEAALLQKKKKNHWRIFDFLFLFYLLEIRLLLLGRQAEVPLQRGVVLLRLLVKLLLALLEGEETASPKRSSALGKLWDGGGSRRVATRWRPGCILTWRLAA